MKKPSVEGSTVLTIRVPKALNRKLARETRRVRQTRSKTACALLESALREVPDDEDPAAEARRQSRLASRRASEKEVLTFIADAGDLRGWE